MDITSDRGFALSLYSLLNTKRGGGCTLAPVCSSWVFVRLACYYSKVWQPFLGILVCTKPTNILGVGSIPSESSDHTPSIVPAAQVAWIDSQNQSFTLGISEGGHRGWKHHGSKGSHSTSHSCISRHILAIRATKGIVV